ncbi:hypothetical protein [Saccharothrix deserti]|uniref:hypothetical protein n=1 Tax=Saccharothrix deserti TaxID=2593674 RepID=UPI00131AFEA8|nr:hypothetical protein [Saccharothrix deserti]
MVGRSRAWWVAGGALVGGGVVWAVLRFGVPVFLADEAHSARPVLEALSWIAGIGGLVVAVVALAVASRQGRDRTAAREVAPPPASQTATGGGVILTGGVTGGSGSGTTTGVHIGQIGGPPDPPVPTRP